MLTTWMHDCKPMTSLSCISIFLCAALYLYMKNDIHLKIVGYYNEKSVTTVIQKYILHLCKIMEVHLLCQSNYWLTVVTSPWSMMYKILVSNGMRISMKSQKFTAVKTCLKYSNSLQFLPVLHIISSKLRKTLQQQPDNSKTLHAVYM